MGVLGRTASFTFFKSCTNRHAVGWPASNSELKTGVIPSIASWRSLYCGCFGLYVDLGVTIRGSTFRMQPTSYLLLAHRVGGTSANRGSSTVICGSKYSGDSPVAPRTECRVSKAPPHALCLRPVAGEKYCPSGPCGSGIQSHAPPPFTAHGPNSAHVMSGVFARTHVVLSLGF